MKVSMAPAEKKAATTSAGSSYQRVMSEKEKEKAAMEEMFSKAKRLDVNRPLFVYSFIRYCEHWTVDN